MNPYHAGVPDKYFLTPPIPVINVVLKSTDLVAPVVVVEPQVQEAASE